MGAMRDRWALEVGRVLLAFGEIEHQTHECLRQFPRDTIYDSVATMPLARRLALIRNILEGRARVSDKVLDFIKLLKRAEDLLVVRNAVAHNPYVLAFYGDGGDLRMTDELATVKGNRRFTFEEIAAAASEAHVVSLALVEQFCAIYHQFSPARVANPSVKPTRSGLRPPRAAYLKRSAPGNS